MSDDDIFLWPDGTWCFRHSAHEYDFMSDDYEVLQSGTERWEAVQGWEGGQ